MRCVNEHIARRVNAAHGGTGRCWALQITGMEYDGWPGIRVLTSAIPRPFAGSLLG